MGENIMATPAEVAGRDGVTKQAVTKLVRRFVEEHDLPVERDGRDRITKFSLAHYDHYRGEFASSEKIAAARKEPTVSTPVNSSTSRDEALRQEAWLKVAREKIRRQEQAGQLIRADRTRDALIVCGREIQATIARLQNKADDMALAVSREGTHGLRVLLREISFGLNNEIADMLATIVTTAAETDEALEDEEL
ncbi:MAG TPA: hypothetical protein VGV39_15135 [Mesorhizobium sp.]|jgi:hypothetical protein|uniref:hypothetical protein n=1 Tax=Mesorhizobium sp. TaxID=1871066 RepID=UPI002DDCF1A8|nr:hypothetical protein [Mesorhizobium sp.]HEV2504411.1 hypothetical protein [Mesorhizobium sp.]